MSGASSPYEMGGGGRPRVVLLGDSLTAWGHRPGGWASAVCSVYAQKADVVTRGFSGYNTRWFDAVKEAALPLPLPDAAATPPPPIALATVLLGANDAAHPAGDAARQHVPLGEYAERLRSIVRYALEAGAERVVLITPPPVDDEGRLEWRRAEAQKQGLEPPAGAERSSVAVAPYVGAVNAVAAEVGAPVVDLFAAFLSAGRPLGDFFEDGLHFKPDGDALVAEALVSTLRGTLAAALPESLPDGSLLDPMPSPRGLGGKPLAVLVGAAGVAGAWEKGMVAGALQEAWRNRVDVVTRADADAGAGDLAAALEEADVGAWGAAYVVLWPGDPTDPDDDAAAAFQEHVGRLVRAVCAAEPAPKVAVVSSLAAGAAADAGAVAVPEEAPDALARALSDASPFDAGLAPSSPPFDHLHWTQVDADDPAPGIRAYHA